jgi:polyisoprenoid-binding protein YceI
MGWTIDPAHTTVGFKVKHLGLSTVRGRFTRFEGDIELSDPKDLTTAHGTVRVDLSSIDTGNEQRDAHLRSADFFNAAVTPEMVLVVRGITPKDGDRYNVDGDLTINGITKPVVFEYEHGGEATDPYGNVKLGGTLRGDIDRREWGITWNVPLSAGGFLVGERVGIEVEGQIAQGQEAVEQEVDLEASAQPQQQPVPGATPTV